MRYLIFLFSFLFAFDANKVYVCEATKFEILKNNNFYYLDKSERLKQLLKNRYQVNVKFFKNYMLLSNLKLLYKGITPSNLSIYKNKFFQVYVDHKKLSFVIVQNNYRIFYKCH